MNYWLMKSEPDVFSIDDLRRKGTAGWDGVRNYQARNFMRAMRKGDLAFFYHSSTDPAAIVGIMEIVREAYPDPTQFDRSKEVYDPKSTRAQPRWDQVDVRWRETFARPLSLEAARTRPELGQMILLKRGRLSVQPVSAPEWRFICQYVRRA